MKYDNEEERQLMSAWNGRCMPVGFTKEDMLTKNPEDYPPHWDIKFDYDKGELLYAVKPRAWPVPGKPNKTTYKFGEAIPGASSSDGQPAWRLQEQRYNLRDTPQRRQQALANQQSQAPAADRSNNADMGKEKTSDSDPALQPARERQKLGAKNQSSNHSTKSVR